MYSKRLHDPEYRSGRYDVQKCLIILSRTELRFPGRPDHSLVSVVTELFRADGNYICVLIAKIIINYYYYYYYS